MTNNQGVPYYCRRCSEMLTAEQPQCPFCGDDAATVDDVMAEMFETRNAAFNEQLERIMADEERRCPGS